MDFLMNALEFIIHLDKYIEAFIHQYQSFSYLVLFIIIFCETGLVVTPFLPGDSLLFIVGAVAASGDLNVYAIGVLLICGALLGDNVNYWIGRRIGNKIMLNPNPRFIKKEYLEKTERFYQKHGGKMVIFARFIPIVRTFAPFVSGIAKMRYTYFLSFSIVGAILWVSLFLAAGYIFGDNPVVEKNFVYVIFAVIFLSVVPAIIGLVRERSHSKKISDGSAE